MEEPVNLDIALTEEEKKILDNIAIDIRTQKELDKIFGVKKEEEIRA